MSRKRWQAHDVVKALALEFALSLTVQRRSQAARAVIDHLKRRGWEFTEPTVDGWLRAAGWKPAVLGLDATHAPLPATDKP